MSCFLKRLCCQHRSKRSRTSDLTLDPFFFLFFCFRVSKLVCYHSHFWVALVVCSTFIHCLGPPLVEVLNHRFELNYLSYIGSLERFSVAFCGVSVPCGGSAKRGFWISEAGAVEWDKMFRPARWWSEKNRVKAVFKLHFHVTQVVSHDWLSSLHFFFQIMFMWFFFYIEFSWRLNSFCYLILVSKEFRCSLCVLIDQDFDLRQGEFGYHHLSMIKFGLAWNYTFFFYFLDCYLRFKFFKKVPLLAPIWVFWLILMMVLCCSMLFYWLGIKN